MRFFRKTDVIIIAALLIVSGAGFVMYNDLAQDEAAKAEIYLGPKLLKTVDLSTKTEDSFSIPGKENVGFHLYEDGSIAFDHSDCPDQVCVNAGRLHIVGQSAACLPNELILKIVPKNDGGRQKNDVVV